MADQDIVGGSCPLLPLQCCILWVARQEKVLSLPAFQVYFASHEVKYWRYTSTYHDQAHSPTSRFQLSDVCRLLPEFTQRNIVHAFNELEAKNIVITTSHQGIQFAETLDDLIGCHTMNDRILSMFHQLPEATRGRHFKTPRRLLRLLVRCGRHYVRTATLLGLLFTTMLTKRVTRYQGYKGCCKASWIGRTFQVDTKRVNLERAKLIAEGWFRRLPSPQRVRNRYGEWVALNLSSHPSSLSPQPQTVQERPQEVENIPEKQLQPLPPADSPQLQPPPKKPVSPTEIVTNQSLAPRNPAGVSSSKKTPQPTWSHLIPDDLTDLTRSTTLFAHVVEQGLLTPSSADRFTFFAAIEHAKRVATHNACGLLHTIVTHRRWEVITQVDEDCARLRLRPEPTRSFGITELPLGKFPPSPPILQTMEGSASSEKLSADAMIVHILTQDLQRAGYRGDIWSAVRNHGYLQEWTYERWLKASQESTVTRPLSRVCLAPDDDNTLHDTQKAVIKQPFLSTGRASYAYG